jgi:hypothetical protein
MRYRILILPLLVFLASSESRSIAEDTTTTALRQEIAASPKSAPAAVTRVLMEAGPKAGSIAAPTVAAAIQALGADPTKRQVASIVYAGVRMAPDSVLSIVRAAVKVAPNAAPDIAAAAVSAVPDPWKPVHYQRQAMSERDAKDGGNMPGAQEGDFKTHVSLWDNLRRKPVTPIPGTLMTLAEAIVQAAFEAGANASLADIQSAVDFALSADPATLFQIVGSPQGISGVGIFGNSNYLNEPRFPVTPTPTPANRRSANRAPAKPTPGVVSP